MRREKIITVDYHKTRKELIIHYRNSVGDKKVRIKRVIDFPVYVPVGNMDMFKRVCGDMIRFVYQKKFHAYDMSTELLKVDMDAQSFLEKKKESVKKDIIKKFNLYQADLNPALVYMVENKLEWEKDLRLVYFDIETNGGLDVESPPAEITSLAFYLDKLDKYYVFSWHPALQKNSMIVNDNITYIIAHDERVMLHQFLKFVKNNFNYMDALIGWSSNHFDIPYIINRLMVLGMNRMMVSPLARYAWTFKPRDARYNKISGVNLLDYLDIYKSKGQYRKISPPNYKLNTIAEFENLGIGKQSDFTWRDWMTNFKGFLSYQVRDVELLVKLEEKLRYIRFLFDFQNIVKLPLELLA